MVQPLCYVCLSALCEGAAAAAVLTDVGDEAVSPKSAVARDRLRSSSSVASPQSPHSSDELGMSAEPHYSALLDS